MRQKQLDGLRAVAILAVMLFHHRLLPWGWAGVDLFFVLSGFLITRILLETRTAGTYWSEFYIKRAGRIIPPLLIVFPVGLLVASKWSWWAVAGYALFLGNYVDITQYEIWAFFVLWSLAVEEHFYLIWPSVIRFVGRRVCAYIAVAILIAEPILRAVFTPHVADFKPFYHLTFFRLDGLTAGSLLALVMSSAAIRNGLKRSAPALFFVSLAAFCALSWRFGSAFTYTANSTLFNSIGYSLIALIGCAALTHVLLTPQGLAARFLSLPPLVFLGEISYGVYLIHTITLSLLRHALHIGTTTAADTYRTRMIFLINLPLSCLLAWLSFRFYELPIVRWSREKARQLRHEKAVVAA